MTMKKDRRQAEAGNALFLILIAVVLFAALSYAITQSNRGGGAPNRETSLVASTTIMQYSSAIRTGVTRQLLRNIAVAQLDFTAPPVCTTGTTCPNFVFHPEGGGVAHQAIDIQAVNPTGAWTFPDDIIVTNVGTAAADLVAILTDVRQPICERIARQVGGEDANIPTSAGNDMTDIAAGGVTLSGADIDGQAFGCVQADDGFVYYHVLVEN